MHTVTQEEGKLPFFCFEELCLHGREEVLITGGKAGDGGMWWQRAVLLAWCVSHHCCVLGRKMHQSVCTRAVCAALGVGSVQDV